jgi:soluble lytic murein transglycosylase-like protein
VCRVDPAAIGRNRNGSRDIGPMQINSTWLARLARHGIAKADLFDPDPELIQRRFQQ